MSKQPLDELIQDIGARAADYARKPAPRNINSRRQIRHQLVKDGNEIVERLRAENREPNTDEEKTLRRIQSEIHRFDRLILESEDAADRERSLGPARDNPAAAPDHYRAAATDRRGPVFALENGEEIRGLLPEERLADLGGWVSEPAELGKFVRGMITGDWTAAGLELKAAAGEGTGSLGGWFVPEVISTRVIDLARTRSVLVRGGAITIPMSSGEMRIVRQLAVTTAG